MKAKLLKPTQVSGRHLKAGIEHELSESEIMVLRVAGHKVEVVAGTASEKPVEKTKEKSK